jgi:hypothetical protein
MHRCAVPRQVIKVKYFRHVIFRALSAWHNGIVQCIILIVEEIKIRKNIPEVNRMVYISMFFIFNPESKPELFIISLW